MPATPARPLGRPRSLLAGCLLLLTLCRRGEATPPPTNLPTSPATAPATAPPTDPAEDIGLARKSDQPPRFAWSELAPAAFARAVAENKLLLLDCVATWCHWCHVMDETTYRDPEVAALLQKHFIPLRVDVDARPDIVDRYESWGWPATILFSPDGAELGKFRGYLAPTELKAALSAALAAQKQRQGDSGRPSGGLAELPAPLDSLGWVGSRVAADLDGFYDEEQGGWGRRQKLPIGPNLEFELARAAHGDGEAAKRARFSLAQQRQLLDPVWGGMYQYSTGGSWDHPHFEKRLPIQTATIEALATAYAATRERRYLDDALRIVDYLAQFLTDKDGAFLVSQDADLGGFEGQGRFVDGHVYYAQSDAERRRLGIPRIDRSVYPYENGLAIAALVRLAQVHPERAAAAQLLTRARRAADLMLGRFVDGDGTVRRTAAGPPSPRFLSDAAALGRGLVLLSTASPQPAPYLLAAQRIAAAMLQQFTVAKSEQAADDPPAAALLLWASSPDPAAVGVFARRLRPFATNVVAARFLTALSRRAPTVALHAERAQQLLRGLSTPSQLAAEGRQLGEYLLALDEAGLLAWQGPAPPASPALPAAPPAATKRAPPGREFSR